MDHSSINHAIARLSLAATGDRSASATLQELCEVASVALEVDSVGVMLTDSTGNRFAHATTKDSDALERLQEHLQSGPCREAADKGVVVVATSPEQLATWPAFGAAAEAAGIAAMVAVPLLARGRCWGVLDLYRVTGSTWTPDELSAIQLLGHVAVAHLVMGADRDTAREAQVQLAHQNNHDQLTGLVNRGLLLDRLTHALATAHRHHRAVGALFIDLDRFKAVNDTHGHDAGDRALREVARRLLIATRDSDTVARLAGDEFVIVCDDLDPDADPAPATLLDTVARRVHDALKVPIDVGPAEITIDASIGGAVAPQGWDAQQLLAAADAQMYRAKH